MVAVLFVDCPESYLQELPGGTLALRYEADAARGEADRPDLVVIGPESARPAAQAQRAARDYPDVDVLIGAREQDVLRLRELLAITPTIPLRTDLVVAESQQAMREAIRRALERCTLRRGHRSVMSAVRESVRSTLSGLPTTDPAAATTSPDVVDERLALRRFFDFYRVVVDELGDAGGGSAGLAEPLGGWGSDETKDTWLALQGDYVAGLSGAYLEALRTVGRTHAEAGCGFGDWLAMAHEFRRSVLRRLPPKASRRHLRDMLWGMETFLNTTLSEIERAHGDARETEVTRSEAQVRLFAVAVESSVDAILTTTVDGDVTAQNAAAEKLYGRTAEDVLGEPFLERVHPDFRKELGGLISSAARGVAHHRVEALMLDRDDRPLNVELSVSPVRDAGRGVVGLCVIARDLTERKRIEASLRQAHRMEAVGRLAGGVAHDFNNLLTVILMHASLLLDEVEVSGGLARESLDEMMAAAERARALTRQLMTFSRRQPLQPRVVDVAEAVRSAYSMLRRTFPGTIEIAVVAPETPCPVHVDRGQLDQLLMNLALNARDAMPDGGRLVIRVEHRSSSERRGRMGPGEYVVLQVQDRGVGIDADVLDQIFEPFFTTKERGKGTGLGLATCSAIVQEAHGDLLVESRLGEGTTFEAWFPRADGAAVPESVASGPETLRALFGTETILVVEDDVAVRRTLEEALRRHGYDVLEASNGEVALRRLQNHGGRVDLVITDTVMPRMGGPELATQLASLFPELPVLLVTGYGDEGAGLGETATTASGVLLKPFLPRELVARVRALLDRA